MRTVGLLGGVGAGKSTVAGILAESGACVLDADRTAAEVLAEAATVREIVARFGPRILDAAGRVDRKALADRAFGGPGDVDRRFLEGIMHPRVRERLARDLEACRKSPPASGLAVLDVPLLVEGPLAAWCDILVFVDAPPDVRARRCAAYRGWNPDEVLRREAAQAPLADKRARAAHVVVNDADLATLRLRVGELLRKIAVSPPEAAPRMKD